MAQYHELRTVAFRLSPHLTELPHQFFTLQFPEAWKSELRNLQAEASNRSPDKVSLPIKTLNQTLRALVPDLIYIAWNAGKRGKRPWLYSTEPINVERLWLIVHNWVSVAFPKASDESRERVLKSLSAEQLQWQKKSIDLASWQTHPNGTAKASDSDSFKLLPALIAAKFSQPGVTLEYGSEVLRFRRAPLAVGSQGAELISWPPIRVPDNRENKNDWFYSVLITLTVQTVPFQTYPVIYCDLGIRRWVSQPDTSIPGGKNTSIYLLTNVPWIRGLNQSHSFQVASVRSRRLSETEQEQKKYQLAWSGQLTHLLDNLNWQQLPTPKNIRANPEAAFNVSGNPSAAIVYRHGMKPEHKVGSGLMPGDRHPLAEQIAKLLEAEFIFTTLLPRVKYPKLSTSAKKLFFDKLEYNEEKVSKIGWLSDEAYVKRRRAIGQATNEQLTIEIFHQSPNIRQMLVNSVCEILGLSKPVKLPQTWHTPQIALTLQAHPLGPLRAPLMLNSSIKNNKKQLRDAINQRLDEVLEQIPEAVEATVTFVELGSADAFGDKDDPKDTLRLAFARTGRLTQFITPGKEKLAHRAKNGFLDLLRQLGVPPRLPELPKQLPPSLNYVGLWLIKQNKKNNPMGSKQTFPILVHIASETGQIRATAPGLDGWLPYQQALLAIGKGQAQGYTYPHQSKTMKFIQKKLENDVLALGETLLICHAHNLRRTWTWLQDGKITIDNIAFGKEPPEPIDDEWEGLRIVRVRSSQSHETPEWYGLKEDAQGFSKGLFKIGQRVFASTYQKPVQFKKISPRLSKASSWTTRTGEGRQPAPKSYAWNPAMYELTVACIQPGDDPVTWAALTHELRNTASHYNESTALPLPLHLAKLVEEYVLLLE